MARSSAEKNKLCQARNKFVLLLCTAVITVAAAGDNDVVTYRFPAFDATTTDNLVAATNSSVLTPASLVFGSPSLFPEFNRSEGFLLLSQTIAFRRAGTGGGDDSDVEASFNSSFTLVAGAAAPVSFVVLKDAFPTFNAPDGLRGPANCSMSAGGPVPSNATGRLAVVEVDAVRSYGRDVPTTGLNVTVTPRAGAGGCAVWVEYRAGVHRLSVYVAGVGEPRPANALVDMPLGVGWHWTTETALVGFFAGAIRDVIDGVRNWDLTVDRLPGQGNKGTSWWVILLAVLGSVVAAAAIVTTVVCYFQTRRRRRQLSIDPTNKI